jgi:hypothetical protein
MLTVVAVRGRAMTSQFLRMAAEIYAGDPCWVPPLTMSARRFMSPRKNPYFWDADIDHFLAVDGGRVLGRISVTVDRAYVTRYGPVGFFGWFEAVKDEEVAAALFERAAAWNREHGMTRLAGPYSYCSTQEFGLLVDGFGTRPAAFQAHNPPYYADLLQAAGFRPSYYTSTYRWTLEDDRDTMHAMAERGEKARRAAGLTVRPFDPRRRRADLDLAYALFQASFAANHDVAPMSKAVFDFQARELAAFLDPRLIRFVERNGEPVAFSMLLADLNEVLAAAGGRLSPSFLLRYRGLVRRISAAVVLMIGALPRDAGTGTGRVLAGEIARVGLDPSVPYRAIHTTWIHQENWQSRALVSRTGAGEHRRYAVLEKDIAP